MRKPIVRHFIPCENVQKSSESQYSIQNIVHTIRALPGANYPRIHPQIVLFVMLTDAQGIHEFCVEVVLWEHGQQRSLWTTKRVKVDLGNDPLHVHGWTIRLNNVLLPQAGSYELVLWCGAEVLARQTILVE